MRFATHLVFSHTRQGYGLVRDRGYDLLRALGSGSCGITHETGGFDLELALRSASCNITHETGVRFVTLGSASCDIIHTRGTICYGLLVLHLVISHTRQGVRFVSGIIL